jgi:hypothetical protein
MSQFGTWGISGNGLEFLLSTTNLKVRNNHARQAGQITILPSAYEARLMLKVKVAIFV